MASPEVLDPVLAALGAAVRQAIADAGLPEADADLERPRQPEHGDWATTAPLRLAKPARRPPRDIAEALLEHLELPEVVDSVEVAGPGFVNFRLAHRYFEDVVRTVVTQGVQFGRRTLPDDERELVNAEFVSSNPTGPLHIGHGRWVAAGDAIAALIEASGHEVHREYYLNDAGVQVTRLSESVLLAARGEPRGPDHYQGDYVDELVTEMRSQHGTDFFAAASGSTTSDDETLAARVGEEAVRRMRDRIAAVLHDIGVDFDTWFSERALHESGALEATIAALRDDGRVYEHDGALFLRTTELGDDKDRVLVKSDGEPTYFAADCAYMRDKRERGYTRLIYILGADHHGYVGRLRAGAEALGIGRDNIEIRIGQLVNLLRGGVQVRQSTRAGEMVTLDAVVNEVGADATRYSFLRHSLDTTMDFDLERIVEQSMANPVYYVQYAHARIASLIRTADERGFDHGELADADLSRLVAPAELELLKALSQLPEVVAEAAELRSTQRVTRYAEELAGTFHRFYTDCRILPSDTVEVDAELGRARYWLAVAAKQVLASTLGLLRVSAPERM